MKPKDLEKELDKLFPKGDKARGKALVLYAMVISLYKEQAKQIFDEIESLSDVFVNYDIIINGNKYKKIKQKHTGKNDIL